MIFLLWLAELLGAVERVRLIRGCCSKVGLQVCVMSLFCSSGWLGSGQRAALDNSVFICSTESGFLSVRFLLMSHSVVCYC